MKVKREKKPQNPPNLRSSVLMYEQQLEHLPFKDIGALETRIKSLSKTQHLLRYAMITHDKDVNESQDPIKDHIHVALIFERRVNVKAIAKALNDEPQQFEVMTKRGNSAKTGEENSLMYLIHRTKNSSNKFQYNAKLVIANFNYQKFVTKMDEQINPKDILDQLGEGKIDENMARKMMMDLGASTYAFYASKIETIANARLEIEYEEWLKTKKQTHKPIKVIWCYGETGTGKTRYALDYATRFEQPYFKTSGSNDPFEGYGGQKILILDELRPEMLKYQDLLQILDPMVYEKKTVARYHNAFIMADIIFVTSPYDPLNFYKQQYSLNSVIDKFEQLNRRIGLILKFNSQNITEQICELVQQNYRYIDVQMNKNVYAGNRNTNSFTLLDLEKDGEELKK